MFLLVTPVSVAAEIDPLLCPFSFLKFSLTRLIKIARPHLVLPLVTTAKALSAASQMARPQCGAKREEQLLLRLTWLKA